MGIAAVGAVGAVASAAGSIANMAGGSNPNSTQGGNPATYIPTNQGGMDANYQSIIAQQMPFAQYASTYGQQLENNPYATGYQTAANTAAAGMPQQGATQLGAGKALYGSGMQALPYGQQILQAGFDPQQALYNSTSNTLMQQLNAQNAASGVYGPAAAGTDAQALGNFNMNWQNNQLGREQTAAAGYGSLVGGVNSAFAGGEGQYGAGNQSILQGGQLPYSTYSQQQQQGIQGAQAALAPGNQIISNLLPYMQLGQNASSLAQSGQAQNFGQMQQLGQGFGSGLDQLASANGWLPQQGQQPTAYGYSQGGDIANYSYANDNSGGYNFAPISEAA